MNKKNKPPRAAAQTDTTEDVGDEADVAVGENNQEEKKNGSSIPATEDKKHI